MLTSYQAGFRLTEPSRPGTAQMLTATSFSGVSRSITWQDMVIAFSDTFPGYLALILFDQSSASQQARQAISDRYMDLDRITGEDLLVLSTVPPPSGWFDHKAQYLSMLPSWSREFHNKIVYFLGTKEGQQDAAFNSQHVLKQFFNQPPRLPCICFLWENHNGDSGETTAIEALAFDISGFRSPEQVYHLFDSLASLARQHRYIGSTAKEFAAAAFSQWNPRSLAWKNAALRSMGLLGFVKQWISTAKS